MMLYQTGQIRFTAVFVLFVWSRVACQSRCIFHDVDSKVRTALSMVCPAVKTSKADRRPSGERHDRGSGDVISLPVDLPRRDSSLGATPNLIFAE